MKNISLYILIVLFLMSCNEPPFVPNYEIKAKINAENISSEEENEIITILQKRFSAYNLRNEIFFIGNEISIKLMDKKRKIDGLGIKKLITNQGEFEFWHTFNTKEVGKDILANADKIISEHLYPGFRDSMNYINTHPEKFMYLFRNNKQRLGEKAFLFSIKMKGLRENNNNSILGEFLIRDTSVINSYIKNSDFQKTLPNDLKFMWGESPSSATRFGDMFVNLHLIKKKARINNSHIAKAKNSSDLLKKHALITLDFTEEGKTIWEEMTKYSVENESEIAMTLDKKVISSSVANQLITQGQTQITGGKFSKENGGAAAYNIVVMLNNGVLQFPISITEFSHTKKKK